MLICSCLAVILNKIFLPSAVTHVRQITELYSNVHFIVPHSSVTIACMGRKSLWKIAFSATRSRTLAFGYRRYSRSIPATVGLLVFQNTGSIHVRLQV